MPGIVAWDFDNTIHPYTKGWQSLIPDMSEAPVPGVEGLLATLQGRGFRQVVFSARAGQREGVIGIQTYLRRYNLTGYFDVDPPVTAIKPQAIAYIDDRAINCEAHDWQNILLQVLHLASRG